tara:strand:- start:424 stop:1347 length:924 start_codon:yes stop_codon:yes gene_type:complete
MKKRNLIFSLAVSSIFIPSIESATINDSLENENNSFEAHEIPIAEAGGGGGIKTIEERESDCKAKAKRAIQFFERQLFDDERFGRSTEENKKKIKEYKQFFLECSSSKNKKSEKKESEKKESEKKECEIKESKIKALSKFDNLGNDISSSLYKNEAIKLIKKADNVTRKRICSEINKLKDEAKNINPSDIDDWLKKAGEYNSKIDALESFQNKIDNFLNYHIETMVYIINLIDNRDAKYTDEEKSEISENYFNYVSKISSAEGFFENGGNSFFKSDNDENNEFWKSLSDLFEITYESFIVAREMIGK